MLSWGGLTFCLSGAALYCLSRNTGRDATVLKSVKRVNQLKDLGPISITSCTALWPNSVNTFMAGNTSTLQVLQKDTRADGVQLISFTPTQAGEFLMYVGNFQEQISGSPFLFKVLPGQINVSSCTGAWKYTQEFGAGDEAQFLVTQRDSYGNVVGLENGRSDIIYFNTSILRVEGNAASLKMTASVDFVTGIQTIRFNPTLAGSFQLIIGKGLQSIHESPFGFTVNTGPVSVAACKGQWLDNSSQFKAGATATLIVIVTDKYGNEFNTSFPFIISVHKSSGLKASNIVLEVIRGSDESYTTVDLIIKEAGSYYLTVGTKKEFISNSPISFSVLAASLSISDCVAVWDDGTNIFNAGSTAMLRILPMDAFGNNISHVTGVFNQNSNYITEVTDASTNEETTIEVSQVAKPSVGYHYIRLDPKVSGHFFLYVGNGRQSLSASPFAFEVIPGPLSLSKSYAFWERNSSELRAGLMASLCLWTKDTFNNVINATSRKNMKSEFLIQATASSPMNDLGQDLNISIEPDQITGCWLISFWPKLLGEFFLQVGTENGNVSNSPMLFTVDSVMTFETDFWFGCCYYNTLAILRVFEQIS